LTLHRILNRDWPTKRLTDHNFHRYTSGGLQHGLKRKVEEAQSAIASPAEETIEEIKGQRGVKLLSVPKATGR
jgi:hypothetical protein